MWQLAMWCHATGAGKPARPDGKDDDCEEMFGSETTENRLRAISAQASSRSSTYTLRWAVGRSKRLKTFTYSGELITKRTVSNYIYTEIPCAHFCQLFCGLDKNLVIFM